MKKVRINPLRLLFIGIIVIIIGTIAKITKEPFYQPILIIGLIIEIISILMLLKIFDKVISYFKNQKNSTTI
jgi:hypothetical protein